jgi:membrane peptidoglycan carboxypeptidase
MGIIQNDGLLLPTRQIEQVQFGTGTPYETVLGKTDLPSKRILSVQVARLIRTCMIDVVEGGTAIRAAKTFGTSMVVGGKTGTGDHRQYIFGPGGIKIKEIYIERSATFVFFIGDCYFGALTVTVLGPNAKDYEFTSSYPVQLFTCLIPGLVTLIAADGQELRFKK